MTSTETKTNASMTLVGVDVAISHPEFPALPEEVSGLKLDAISNRGTKVYPGPAPEVMMTDWWRCRYRSTRPVGPKDVAALLTAFAEKGLLWTEALNLFEVDGVTAYSKL